MTISSTDMQAVSAAVQAGAAIVIMALTIALVKATRRYAVDTARMANLMKEQWDGRFKQRSEESALRLATALVQIDNHLSRDRAHQDMYREAFHTWQTVWLAEHSLLQDDELNSRLEVFGLMLGEMATTTHPLGESGRPALIPHHQNRITKALVSAREALLAHGSGRELGPADLPHPDRWGDWIDANPGARIEDYQASKA